MSGEFPYAYQEASSLLLADLLGVPPGAYERGNDFIKRAIEPAVLEVNGLSEFGVKIGIERAYSRAPIAGVTLGWWSKTATNTARPGTYAA